MSDPSQSPRFVLVGSIGVRTSRRELVAVSLPAGRSWCSAGSVSCRRGTIRPVEDRGKSHHPTRSTGSRGEVSEAEMPRRTGAATQGSESCRQAGKAPCWAVSAPSTQRLSILVVNQHRILLRPGIPDHSRARYEEDSPMQTMRSFHGDTAGFCGGLTGRPNTTPAIYPAEAGSISSREARLSRAVLAEKREHRQSSRTMSFT